MTNLKYRVKKLEAIKTEKQRTIVLRNDIELQMRSYNGEPHEPFITYVNDIKIIHCLTGQDIDHLM